MNNKRQFTWSVGLLILSLLFVLAHDALAAPTTSVLGGGIAINEILIDPNSSTNNFDTDGNGTADTLDEFVEIYNLSGAPIDISGFQLWDDGTNLWFTFPSGTILGADNYAVVVAGVQTDGSLPAVSGGNLAFDAGRSSGVLNNSGDNIVLYDPGADEYIQLLYNGDAADDPPVDYAGDGFSTTATLVGTLEDWGSDTDGISLVRNPAGDTSIVLHNTISSDNASPGDAAPPPVDAAPKVESTTPGDGDANVALDANITIDFSEAVTVSGSWFDISCTASGGHTATVSGGSQNFMLDPDTDFDNAEICTVTVYAAQVVDQDGNPDSMTGDVIFSFTTVDDAPSTAMLVINEIDYDQLGTDTAEFIEIKNVGAGTVNLDGYDLLVVNGSGGGAAIAATIHLPNVDLVAGDYYVVCSNAATVDNCDLDVSPDSNLIQNGAPDAVALVLGDNVVDTVSYEGDTGAPYTEATGAGLEDDPDVVAAGISRYPDGMDTNVNNLDLSQRCITPGEANTDQSSDCAPVVLVCYDPATFIHDIQGAGDTSPLVGTTDVIIEGVVVGDFQNTSNQLSGFFVQEEDGQADADATTSEGIFVYDPGFTLDVNVGDVVRLQGNVSEFSGLTEINNVTAVTLCDTGASASPAIITLPVTNVGDWEFTEGMLVTFPQSLYISEYFNFDRFGEIVLTTDRQFQPTAVYEPGSPEAAQLAQDNLLSRITLDDGRSVQNPDPALHPNGGIFDLTNLFRGGDTVQNVTGVLDYSFGLYRIQPTQGADYIPANPRTAQPDNVGGNLKVASFNVLNYFTTLGSRGADDALEFERQRNKIFAALASIDADVVGLIEIENNGLALQDLVAGLNDVVGAGTYAYVDTGVIGVDEITVAFIYKPATVSLEGNFAVLDDPSFTDPLGYGEQKSRPALAQAFIDNNTGGVFTVVVNHLKSKSSACGTGDDDPIQGNCNLTRKLGAQALVDWLAADPTGSSDDDFLVIGDLNAYDKEDPIDALLAGGYTDLIYRFQGEYAYSYVFDGQLGYLDHALASPGLMDEITGVTVWHINADEPDLIDYDMTFKQDAQDALYEPNAYRSSDHDPVISGLSVCDEIAPTLEVTLSKDLLWPPNHKYQTVQATVNVSDDTDPNPMLTLSVNSNEPDNGLGDGDQPNDIVIVDGFTFDLRAERSGTGDGRIYTITYQATDACGNSTLATATVTVPHSQGK